jgi:DNA-binding transcriptional LysR family regulator
VPAVQDELPTTFIGEAEQRSYSDPVEIELRHLRYFVAVAEERHFGRASERLVISQPALSETVQQLERRLAVTLLDRSNPRRTVLTPAGEALLDEARAVLARLDAAVRVTRCAGRNPAAPLRVGFLDGEPSPLVQQTLHAVRRERPDVAILPRRLLWSQMQDAVRDDLVDAAFTRLPIDLTGLRAITILHEPRYVMLSADHPLTTREAVSIAELADLPVVANVGAPPVWSDFWQVNPRPDGSPAPQGPLVHNLDEGFEAIALGGCCGFFPESMLPAVRARPDLGHARVTDIDGCELAVVVHAGEPASPGLSAFIDVATRSAPR